MDVWCRRDRPRWSRASKAVSSATILVQEGAIVQQGQSLMRIEDTKFASEFGEIRERRAAMAARVARLEAEARGRSEVTFPDQLDQVVPAAVATETSVFKMRVAKGGAGY